MDNILFEVSWEVCNKVGGIHTVLTTKARVMKQYYKDYIFIGPYFEDKAQIYFKKKNLPHDMEEAFKRLREQGIICHYGSWLLTEKYDCILVEFSGFAEHKDSIKESLFLDYQIDSLKSAWDFDEPIIWSTAVAKLIVELGKIYKGPMVGHFHEWMAGAAILYLKKHDPKIATIFTTHATMLGRSIAGNGQDLYKLIETINPEQKAYELNIQDKFLTERACAHNADIFTTVSEITAIEAEKLLGKKPDVLTLNGIDSHNFPTVEEFSVKHVLCREKIKELLKFHFFPYYTFDLNHTSIIFISGRYEFRNKGIDIFIKALAKVNEKLKSEKINNTIAAFFWVPSGTKGIKTEILENQSHYRHIKNYVNFHSEDILKNIITDLIHQSNISKSHILSDNLLLGLKKNLLAFKRKGNPSISTHFLSDPDNDPTQNLLIQTGLDNKKDDKVKVILNPVYLEGNDGLINLPYYDVVAGCHLGVFPSYYEPWGYTPMEATAMGVPAITSDLAGYGRFVQSKIKHNMDDGIFVLERFNKPDEEAIQELADIIYRFCTRTKHERAKNKLNAKQISDLADWKILIENYIKAHNMALRKK